MSTSAARRPSRSTAAISPALELSSCRRKYRSPPAFSRNSSQAMAVVARTVSTTAQNCRSRNGSSRTETIQYMKIASASSRVGAASRSRNQSSHLDRRRKNSRHRTEHRTHQAEKPVAERDDEHQRQPPEEANAQEAPLGQEVRQILIHRHEIDFLDTRLESLPAFVARTAKSAPSHRGSLARRRARADRWQFGLFL